MGQINIYLALTEVQAGNISNLTSFSSYPFTFFLYLCNAYTVPGIKKMMSCPVFQIRKLRLRKERQNI